MVLILSIVLLARNVGPSQNDRQGLSKVDQHTETSTGNLIVLS